MVMLLALGTAIAFSSCSKDSEEENDNKSDHSSTIVDGIDISLIPGIYEFNGNIAPSFELYKDGSCEIHNNGLSGSITYEKWSYDKTTHVLLVGTHVYTIKLLTENSFAAEWTSVNYGVLLSSWIRKDLSVKYMKEGHELVDLGLSVKWATMNIGADKPEDYGWYLAWGETEPQSSNKYTWSSYKWCNGSSTTITKYSTDSWYGEYDGLKFLSSEDDAACANWGGGWRTPTADEQRELINRCIWEWTTLNGVNGYKVSSKSSNKSIFLPAAGFCGSNGPTNVGTKGSYMSSKLDKEESDTEEGLGFNSTDYSKFYYISRYIGCSVRPVCY